MKHTLQNAYEEFVLIDINENDENNNFAPQKCKVVSAGEHSPLDFNNLRESHFQLNKGTFVQGEIVELFKINQWWAFGNESKMRLHLKLILSEKDILFLPN